MAGCYEQSLTGAHLMSKNSRNLLGLSLAVLCMLLLTGSLLLINESIDAADKNGYFDHFTTGFPLTGAHQFLDCSRCHIDGTYKGTPLECGLCHNNSRAPGKHAEHISSSNRCDDCHTDRTWTGARFDHGDVTDDCSSCHNKEKAAGKPATHLPTTDECNNCHVTTGWRVTRVNHSAITGLCLGCHNGSISTGKSTTHFVTTHDCERCHSTARWIPLILFRHDSADYPGDHRTGVICTDCHRTNNQVIASFFAYNRECAACHADDYVPSAHNNLPISDVTDCSGSCHIDGVTRSGQHRPSGRGW